MRDIAEHAEIDGRRFTSQTWHRQFVQMYIGSDELPDGTLVPKSSESLTREQYSQMDEQIVAFAVSELGISFDASTESAPWER
jgi:hypothetical protein